MLEKNYQEVRAIVHKCRKEYYLHLWEKEDWDQEGMICLHELMENHPEFKEKKNKQFYIYFKTKFDFYIKHYYECLILINHC